MNVPRRRPPVVAFSGPSGVGKTRLLSRLIPALARRGVRVAVLKHTGHPHGFDVPGKDTEVLRRAGAVAAAIEGPTAMALHGPPAGGLRALLRLLPPVDLVLAEGWKREPLPRVEVHRRRIAREFLCARDRRVFAVVTDEPPPRPVPALGPGDEEQLADLLCARFGLRSAGRPRLPGASPVRSLPPEGSERAVALGRREAMAKTTNRRGTRSGRRTGTGRTPRAPGARRRGTGRTQSARSAAARKGGTATLRNRGPEFYSEIGRKGGRSRASASRRRKAAGARRRSGARRRASGRSSRRP